MTWNEDVQAQIEITIERHDISEVVSLAVSTIAEAAADAVLVKLGHSVGCDPAQTADYGQRLLCAAIDKIREERR